jgi:hypothetical protein
MLSLNDKPQPMDHHEKMRLRSAAFRATRLYPGPVGELVSRELLSWEEFGYRLGGEGLIYRLVDHVLSLPTGIEKPRLVRNGVVVGVE